jgi:peroxiredoxin
MKFKILGIFLIVAMVLSLGACGKRGGIQIGQQAPDFSLPNLMGKSVSLSDFKGKVIILDFFASWCPPCRAEVPDFAALQDQYSSQGFTMVGVSLVSPDETKEFAINYKINYPVLINDGNVSSLYGPIRSIPTTFLIDKEMKVVKIYIGFRPKEVFENDIKELLR